MPSASVGVEVVGFGDVGKTLNRTRFSDDGLRARTPRNDRPVY